MSKNDTISKLAKKALEPEDTKTIKRTKTSIYVERTVYEDFKKLTKHPRGRTSEIIEDFMREYVKIHSKI